MIVIDVFFGVVVVFPTARTRCLVILTMAAIVSLLNPAPPPSLSGPVVPPFPLAVSTFPSTPGSGPGAWI